MNNRKHLAVSLVIALALAGCAGGEAVKPSSDEKGATSAQTSPAGECESDNQRYSEMFPVVHISLLILQFTIERRPGGLTYIALL